MTNREMTSQEARDEWAALVAGAEYRGETTIITRYGNPVAVVGPIDLLPKETEMHELGEVTVLRDDSDTVVVHARCSCGKWFAEPTIYGEESGRAQVSGRFQEHTATVINRDA